MVIIYYYYYYYYYYKFLDVRAFLNTIMKIRVPHNAVGIAMGFGLDGGGIAVRFPAGERDFSSPQHPDWL
jgi:hypothetical protein